MKQAILTSCEGDYDLGVAALFNSAVESGFQGEFHIYYKGAPPRWKNQFKEKDGRLYLKEIEIVMHKSARARHMGYDKPFQAAEVLEGNTDINTVFYADADVVFLCPWMFMSRMAHVGVGVVMDSNFPLVPSTHPWRIEWLRYCPKKIINDERSFIYPNGGFFCVQRENIGFLDLWKTVTSRFETDGGDTRCYHMEARWQGVNSDQDLLAAALSAWDGPVSIVGPEAMGFTGHYFILSHAIERPKPWRRFCVKEALRGHAPKRTVYFYQNYANGDVNSLSSFNLALRRIDYRIARMIGCIYRRPNA